MKQLRFPTYFLQCLLVVFVCFTSAVASAETKSHLAKIRVGIDLWPGYYPVVIAQQQGYFRKRGLRVEYFVPENTDKMLEEFVAGQVDVVCVALGDVFALKERAPSLRVVMISDESAGGDALLSLNPLPDKLTGLRIGTNLNGFGELFVRAFLAQHHAQLQDVHLVNLEASDAGIMLKKGEVDIAHTWEPYVSELTGYQDAEVVFSSEQTPGLIPDAVVMHGDFLQQPKLAKAFVAGWLEAADWWLKHRHEGNRIVEKALVMMPNTVNLEGIRLFDGDANHKAFQRHAAMSSLYGATQKYIDYFTEKGLLKTRMSSDDILTSDLLP